MQPRAFNNGVVELYDAIRAQLTNNKQLGRRQCGAAPTNSQPWSAPKYENKAKKKKIEE